MKMNRLAKAHGRSIKGFDLHEALMKCKDVLSGFGGHTMAVGVAVKQENLLQFKKKFLEIAKSKNISELKPFLSIDKVIFIDEINKKMVEDLSFLEPYGEANEMPVFAFKELKIDSIKSLSEGKHLKLTLKSDKNTYINAIGFNLGEYVNYYKIGDRVDIAGNLEINSFNGVDSIQINIKDVMKSI